MCTVSIVPHDDGFRLACNRDERRARPVALAPSLHRRNHRVALFPVDPLSGGTWIGVNDVGLTMALLNRTVDPGAAMRTRPLHSRGHIIPALLGCGSVTEALEVAATLDPASFDLFRLVVAQHTTVAVMTSNGVVLSIEMTDVSRPLMRTSSSLGDAIVEAPRRRLFEQLVTGNEDGWPGAQCRFHDHQWPSNPHISVRMERPDALTVSRTVIDVSSQAIDLCYEPLSSPDPLAVKAA